ncbi:MAG: diadenylate cyclase CdaA [Oscillospiraceae bacterium]|nr:diadenylate cyclase CdaA [Oscillospiraceae bacterium]
MDTLRELIEQVPVLLLSLRNTVGFWDVLDILIITFIIYRVLSFMHKTSASSVMKGIVFVVAVAWISNLMNMAVLNFLLRQVLQMGIIVLIILFQPEIRKMFERMGTSRFNFMFLKRGRYENIETGIESAAAASIVMAKSKTGAIIVFEREVGLNDYAVTGTSVDAKASSELIQNIFFHNSPLHDGALIIREGRILAAACMLPLSNNINLSRDLGMRHRAGVGISERSDAVVLIVSEQTGTVSIAVDGMLKRHLSEDTVEKLLQKELILAGNINGKSKKGRIKES